MTFALHFPRVPSLFSLSRHAVELPFCAISRLPWSVSLIFSRLLSKKSSCSMMLSNFFLSWNTQRTLSGKERSCCARRG